MRLLKSECTRLATLNIGTLSGRIMEIIDMMMRRRIEVLCLQEIRWRGNKSRFVNGYQIVCGEGDGLRNGVAVVLSPRISKYLVEVKRVNERLKKVILDIEGESICIISAYAPQTGLDKRTKEEFYAKASEMVERLNPEDTVVLAGDWNGHVGKAPEIFGDYSVHGGKGYGRQNVDGLRLLDFAQQHHLAVLNTMFEKRESHLATYYSGAARTC